MQQLLFKGGNKKMNRKRQREINHSNINEDFWFLKHNGYSFVEAIEAIDIAYIDVTYDVVIRELSLSPL